MPRRNFPETLRKRAEWESPGAGYLRWLITFACLFAGPVLVRTTAPAAGIPLVLGVLGVLTFWIWWSVPFIQPKANLLHLMLNLSFILAVILVNLAAILTMATR